MLCMAFSYGIDQSLMGPAGKMCKTDIDIIDFGGSR